MRGTRLWMVLAFGLALGGTALAAPPAGPAAGVKLAVLPCTDIEATFRKFQPLLAYLESTAGLRVQLVVPASLDDFETSTRNGQFEFALQDPDTFKSLMSYFDPASLLQTVGLDGRTDQAAVVVVRRESGIRDVTQLRGRSVMFGPRASSTKWVAARRLFEMAGVSPDRDLRAQGGGCCEDIGFSVLVQAVDAGVVCEHFLQLHTSRERDMGTDPQELVAIARTRPVPTRVLAARQGVPADVVAKLKAALLRLGPADPTQRGVLEGAEISRFVAVTREAYVRAIDGVSTR